MTDCEINELLEEPDNVEIIREQVAAIIHLECANQYALALEKGAANSEDYNIKVRLEHELPISLKSEDDVRRNFPSVNISLDSTTIQHGSTKAADKTMKATILVDCYNHGNVSGDGLTGRSANVAAWKTARIVRNILCASNYTYLKLRGIVGGREVVRMQSGKPRTDAGSANVSVVRITLEVTYDEQSQEVEGAELGRMMVTVDSDGLVCLSE